MPSLALSEHGNRKCILLFPTFSIAYGDKNGGASLCRWSIRTIQMVWTPPSINRHQSAIVEMRISTKTERAA
ncbi:MAG: hypothetical protein JAZ02_08995, partial [Candidatus Thiodiazotropha endolucinida]|nr:hypothetical protein [Candidatus Thiodiazotropha endolucinida]